MSEEDKRKLTLDSPIKKLVTRYLYPSDHPVYKRLIQAFNEHKVKKI